MRNLAVCAALAAAALAAPALAATAVSDPKDAGSSRLDLKTVTADATSGAIVLTLRTWGAWPTSYLAKPSGKRYACVYLWRAGSSTRGIFDFQVCSSSAGGALKASVYDVAAEKVVATGTRVSRAGKSGLRYTIPKSLLGGGASYSWRAGTRDGGSATLDLAPVAPRSTPLA